MAAIPPSVQARRFFVDSSAYLALVDRKDEHHSEAIAILTALARARYRPYTTNTILIEAHALILSELGNHQALQFVRETQRSHTTVIRARASDKQRAIQL